MARSKMIYVHDLAEGHPHEDWTDVAPNTRGALGDIARLARTLQDVGRVLVVYFDQDANELQMRSLPTEIEA
jgi:hypothetical protein